MLLGSIFSVMKQAIVTLSGGSATNVQPQVAGTARVAIRVNTDGTIDKLEIVTYTQLSALTDWIRPETDADDTYEVKIEENSCTTCAGSVFTSPAGGGNKGLSTWYALTENREWKMERNQLGVSTWNFTMHIRRGTGSDLDAAVYQLVCGQT